MKKTHQKKTLERLCDSSPHLLLLFVLFFIGLLYSNTLNSPPVLDDRATFITNPAVHIDNLSPTSLKQVYSGSFGQTRFIPMLSFAVDHLLSQGNIAQFHRTNILIHILATMAIYLLALGLTSTTIGQKNLVFLTQGHFCLFVAALWAIHPIQTNGVTYMVQRMASLVALFYFTALAGYVWARTGQSGPVRAIGWAVFFIAMLCAFFSKENSATLPLAILMVELIFIKPNLTSKLIGKIRRHHWLILAIVFLLLLPLATTKLAETSSSYAAGGRHFTLPERLFTELRVVIFYLSLLALPLPGRFNLDHDFPVSHSLLDPASTILALLLLVLLIYTAFQARRQNPLISFGIFFFFLNLVIESSVIPLELVFEHRLYLPSLGFFIVIVALLDQGCRLIPIVDKKELKKIVFLGILITNCALAINTSLRNNVWRDKLTLYNDIVLKSPLKPRPNANLGFELIKSGRYEEALAVLQKAIALGKGQSEEYLNAANSIVTIFMTQEKFQEAADWAEKLIKDRPQENLNSDAFPLLIGNLGVAYWKLGKFTDSLEAFRIGIRTHHPTHTRLLLATMEAMLFDASTSEEGRQQLDLANGAKSINVTMAAALLMDKEYNLARTYLAKALTLASDKEKSLAIKKIIDDETTRNQRALVASSLANTPASSTGSLFRLSLYLSEFIEKRYAALSLLVGPLLKRAVHWEPTSLPAALRLARWHLQNGNAAEALILIESHSPANSDSPPLLELAGQLHFITGQKVKAAVMFNKLLGIYPGHPVWRRYEELSWN